MLRMLKAFIQLGSKSARFAVRLFHAGTLSALLRLAFKAREHPGWATAVGAGMGARDTTAQLQEATMKCLTIFEKAVPQVSTWG